MIELLEATIGGSQAIPWQIQLPRLISAFCCGVVIVWIYRFCRRQAGNAAFPATLVMLSVLIAMVTQVVGDNVARAFSLVGALSIVRFRTVVRDTKDTAFVIFAVVVGMALGAGQGIVALCGIGVLSVAAIIYRDPNRNTLSSVATVAIRLIWSEELERTIVDRLRQDATSVLQQKISTVRQGTAFELTYAIQLKPSVSPSRLIHELLRIEGIQNVDFDTATVEEL